MKSHYILGILTGILLSSVCFGSANSAVVDLWNGKARLSFQRELKIDPNIAGAGGGWVVVEKGVWYWFYRDTPEKERPATCPADYIRAVVRKSSDQGKTWSAPVVVAEPDPSPGGTGCTVLDGSTFLDTETDTWHLLAQCLAPTDSVVGQGWHLCHYTRKQGPEGPFGPFTADPRNPALISGSVFPRICQHAGSHCPTEVWDEGTPTILSKDKQGYFTVTFHGANSDGRVVHGYRGAAKSRDFHHWITEASDGSLPQDALFSPSDCTFYNPGCIGSGEASEIFGDDGNLYLLIETPNISLSCTPGQFWPFVLVRGRGGLVASGKWEFPTKLPIPLLKPAVSQAACGLQYARWVLDPNGLFLIYLDTSAGLHHYLYKVEAR